MRSVIYHELSGTQQKLEGKCVSVGVDALAVVWRKKKTRPPVYHGSTQNDVCNRAQIATQESYLHYGVNECKKDFCKYKSEKLITTFLIQKNAAVKSVIISAEMVGSGKCAPHLFGVRSLLSSGAQHRGLAPSLSRHETADRVAKAASDGFVLVETGKSVLSIHSACLLTRFTWWQRKRRGLR